MPRLLLAALAVAAAVLTGCTTSSSGSAPSSIINTTVTTTITHTPPAPTETFTPKPATTVAPLPPGQAPAAGEVEKPCPYILSSQDQGPNSMADLEGDRVYRTTVLTGTNPVGCRFYFWAPPYEAIAEITAQRFGTALAAHNAMVLTAEAGRQAQSYPGLLPGVDAISYQTKFLGSDDGQDWACVFTKGTTMVIVRTQQTNTSLNARLIAAQIAPKF